MKKILPLIFFCFAQSLWATHNRAGEITYRFISGFTYEVTITTYTRGSVQADRCVLTLFWGDGTSSKLYRVNGPLANCESNRSAGTGVNIGGDVQRNIYVGRHTYATAGLYDISFEDPNRNAGINNIPQSVSVPFFVKSQLVVDAGLKGNSSPVLLNPPIDDGCLNRRFEHNPGAFDPDGDSLSYDLVDTRSSGGTIITSTYDPNLVQDSVKIDQSTGDLYWDVPKNVGQYNFAIEISEWRRNGQGRWVKIGYVTRDMQVNINNCGNNPPVIQPVGPFCVEAGTNLNFDVTATDVDGDPITLTAFGGPFKVDNPADTFIAIVSNPATGTFNWDTECNHVRQQPFYVTFQAKDDPSSRQGQTPLVDVYTTEIRVIAPAPKNPVATGGDGEINLIWNESICKQATGYKIYRREESYGFVPSDCETGVPAYTGYQLLDSTSTLTDTIYKDTIDLIKGVRYCYMVVACFPQNVESYASVEFCTAVRLSTPLLTNVDVISTDATNGQIDIKWVFPPEVDSFNFPPPYSYKLYRADGIDGTNFTEIQTLPTAADTSFMDMGLNTEDRGYNYKVEMYYGNPPQVLGESDPASSVFLKVTGSDKVNVLRATHITPWKNNLYLIFRETAPGSGQFDSIGQSFVRTYIDSNLENGTTYCYRVQTIGAYTGSIDLPSPLINHSQEACGTPIDTTRPCAPQLKYAYNCVQDSIYFQFTNPSDSGCINDIIGYNIYFKEKESDAWPTLPLLTITSGNSITLTGEPITGCWAATAIDDAGNDPDGQVNESRFSEVLCIESCPEIVFPNVFTPNGDGQNDNFLPVSLNDIGQIDIQIFNRWGTLVFQSTNINDFAQEGWDGTDQNSGQMCSDGVYFYFCRFTPMNFSEPVVHEINGFIHLFQNQ
jgi:gliding motility-associated-like protein